MLLLTRKQQVGCLKLMCAIAARVHSGYPRSMQATAVQCMPCVRVIMRHALEAAFSFKLHIGKACALLHLFLASPVYPAAALFELAKKIPATAAIDCAPTEPPSHVYLGEKYVNNQTLSDVTFLVEGQEFYAHRIALLASSDIFR